MLALVLPALAPLFLGLLSFGEYSRPTIRYRAVAAELRVAALERIQPDRAGLLRVARRISEMVLAEAADWQVLVKARTLLAY